MKKAEEHQAVSFCLVFDVTARTTTPIVGGGGRETAMQSNLH